MNQLPPEPAAQKQKMRVHPALWSVGSLLGCFGLGVVMVGMVLVPYLRTWRIGMADRGCMRRLHQLSRAMQMYAGQNDSVLPASDAWMDRLEPYVRGRWALHCPAVSVPSGEVYGFAANSAIGGKRLDRLLEHPETPSVFDSILTERNAAGTLATLPRPGRHPRGDNVASIDGHVRHVPAGGKP